MCGKKQLISLIPSLAALLLCGYVIALFLQQRLTLFIHPRYSLFAVGMSIIGIAAVSAHLFFSLRNPSTAQYRPGVVDSVAYLFLIAICVVPAQPLSSFAAGRQSLVVPSYETIQQTKECHQPKNGTIDTWVRHLSVYPSSCYKGALVNLTGYVVFDPNTDISTTSFYLGRTIISCCIIDARPYALPIVNTTTKNYKEGTWLAIEGTLQFDVKNRKSELAVMPTSITPISPPSNPYGYITSEGATL